MAKVKCVICGQEFDYTKVQAVKSNVHKRRYSHFTCEPNGELVPLPEPKPKSKKVEKVRTPQDDILDYCKQIFKQPNYARIKQQIKQYKEEYGYSESGILKSLQYWYEIKHEDPDKAMGGIGIVPFIYNDAYSYYLGLFIADQANSEIDIAAAANQTREVTIKIKPKRRFMRLFSLEEEVEDEKE